jgi:peroxiredoxin Q/BCP
MTEKNLVQRVLTPFGRSAPVVGDRAPLFVARTHERTSIDLRDFRGRYLVLYFYPKAFTRGCTAEARAFRDHFAELRALGATVVGVSPDAESVQRDFATHHQLPFPLIADDGAVCRDYAATRAVLPLTRRVTFVIDPHGRIVARFHHELDVSRHLENVLAFLRARTPLDAQERMHDA